MNVSVKNLKSPEFTVKDWLASVPVPSSTLLWTFAVVFVILLAVGLAVILDKRSTMSNPTNVTRITQTQIPVFEDQVKPYFKAKNPMNAITSDPLERCLVNYAPLTMMNPGYLGPEIDGVYNEAVSIRSGLRAGARCFVLPIDYHEDDSLQPPLYARKGEPCLLYRDQGGVIRSLNSGSIQRIAEVLADTAFNDILNNKNDPILLILYFIRTPPPNTKEYLRYLSSVAKQLSPLTSYHLGQTSEGVYNRQARQKEILFTDISIFERKVILFSNADTSLFRNPQSVGLPPFTPREDLDFWVHLRLFKQSPTELGVTKLADDKTFAYGIAEQLSYYTVIPEDRKQSTVDFNKIRWILAVNPPGTNPSNATTKSLLDALGVQCIPLSFFTKVPEDETSSLALWTDSAWRFKPVPVRFRKPEPIQPKAPSPQLNAMEGKITSPQL
jgi:hypothetical protein